MSSDGDTPTAEDGGMLDSAVGPLGKLEPGRCGTTDRATGRVAWRPGTNDRAELGTLLRTFEVEVGGRCEPGTADGPAAAPPPPPGVPKVEELTVEELKPGWGFNTDEDVGLKWMVWYAWAAPRDTNVLDPPWEWI